MYLVFFLILGWTYLVLQQLEEINKETRYNLVLSFNPLEGLKKLEDEPFIKNA